MQVQDHRLSAEERQITTQPRLLTALRLMCVLGISAVFLCAPARADLVILKDGFVLHGRIRQDKVSFSDPISKQVFYTAKLDGFYMVDDDARRMIFSAGQVADATQQDFTKAADSIRLGKVPRYRGGKQLDLTWKVKEIVELDKLWHRSVKLETPTRTFTVTQKLTHLTPHHVRFDAYDYNWTECYLTSELGPEAVRTLFLKYLGRGDQKPKLSEVEKRFHLFRFLLQAGWPDVAEKELRDLEGDYPKEKTRIDENRLILKKLQGLKLADAIELADKAGQPREARRLLDQLKRLKIDADTIGENRMTEVQAIDRKRKRAEDDLKVAKKFLLDLPERVTNINRKQVLAEAARVIADDLRLDTLGRLEGFIGMARQEERYRSQSKRGGQDPAELLAMAVSGWLMGNDSAEAAPDNALKLWQARRLVLKYQNTSAEAKRRAMLSLKFPVGIDELAQMIRFLPPPEPEKVTDTRVKELQAGAAGGGRGPTYLLKLPPEYHHQRAYPVFIALHGGSETARDQINRWSDLAGENGYILAAPVWNKGLDSTYGYSPEEHAIVTDVIRDLRRHYQIDSDRVCLFGFEEGGNMAFDVGLSHPDLFAAVATMVGKPRWHAYHYWPNAQNLPFYVVDGSANALSPVDNRNIFKQWVNNAYPCIYVEYQGRSQEWLSGEMPCIMEWLGAKRRAQPRQGLGGRQYYKSMRSSDNHFYWLSTSAIKDGCVNEPGSSWKEPTPALFEGNIGSSNYIYVSTRGLRDVTVWLGPAAIDFEKPVTIRLNGTIVCKKLVPPSLETMMEDLYERGDRHRLFLAKRAFNIR